MKTLRLTSRALAFFNDERSNEQDAQERNRHVKKRNSNAGRQDRRNATSNDDAREYDDAPILSSAEFLRRYANADLTQAPGDDKDVEKARRRRERRERRNERTRNQDATTPSETTQPPRGKKGRNVGSEPGERGDAVGLRVIGGRLRALKLEYAGDNRVRPMKDRTREAIFNLLGDRPKGMHAIDLFAGTGALTFEALSRGAASATAIEIHFPTARVTKRNISAVEEREPSLRGKITLVTTDVFFWARKLAALDGERAQSRSAIEPNSQAELPRDLPWLVFCSPPYDFWVKREREMLDLLDVLRQRAPTGSVFVIEADERFDFELLNAEIPPKKRRSYPPAEVAIFTV